MTDTFATSGEFDSRVSDAYTAPSNVEQLLTKASELLDHATQGQAQDAFDAAEAATLVLLSDATCDQVEYWLEVGEEHDVVGLTGAMTAGRVQVQRLPGALSPRALRTLLRAGIGYGGVGIIG